MNQERETKWGRREFLTAAGAAAGGLTLAGCSEKGDPYALEKSGVPGESTWSRGEEKWIATACGMCAAGCGIRVRVVEGRAVKIEGHPDCPLNRGGVGPKGQSGLQLLYHPDRIRGPLRRDGARGSGSWKRVSWDDALGEIGRALRELRSQGESRGVVVLDGEPRGMMPQLWDRFLEAYGSPNHIDHHSATDGGKVLATAYMHGVPELPAYDWENTQYVLGFGASLFESWCQSIHFMRAAVHMRRGVPGRRAKFVQVSPRFSVTAARADEWVPIEPATYGALALGLAHVLIKEDLYDEAFVRDHTFGFEPWKDEEGKAHRGFRDLVLEDYPPDKVSPITGVPVETIVRLAQEMAAHRPAISLADGGAAAATNGLGTAMAIHALNALLGNLERPGGMIVQRAAPLAPWKAVEADETARKNRQAPRIDGTGDGACPLGRGFIQGLPETVLSGNPYPVKALFLYRSNPVFSKPDGRRWAEAIQKIPLVVSFSPLPDESTFWADFILPESTYFERWEIVEPVPSVGHPVVTFRQPVVAPLYDTMAAGDALIRLANAVGSPVADAFPWESYRKALEERIKGFLGKEGSTAATKMSALIKGLQKDGGWWAPGYSFEKWETAFPTPSGKFEFYSREIAGRLAKAFPDAAALEKHLAGAGVATRGDDLCLPHWEPPRFSGSAGAYPFVLVVYRGINYAEGGVRHIPGLRELPGSGRLTWKERIELNPEDARHLGIDDGTPVRVESPAGVRVLYAQIFAGVRPGTVALPLGHGPWPPEPTLQVAGGYGLLDNLSDPLGGILALQGTRVRILKEEGV
ncbi:MAG: molybdopterin-dependent oxidoreductase [Planctomycetes bacterium]|nr:molybdopterin-dependent oxidoreductase [Planctomycetota bacterium]